MSLVRYNSITQEIDDSLIISDINSIDYVKPKKGWEWRNTIDEDVHTAFLKRESKKDKEPFEKLKDIIKKGDSYILTVYDLKIILSYLGISL